MLRTRLLTAAFWIPAIWVLAKYVPDPLFNGFIVAVAAVGLYEYFTMAFPDRPGEAAVGLVWGIALAGAVVWARPEAWGAALSLAVVGGFVVLLFGAADLSSAAQRFGLMLLGVVYVGFLTPHFVLLRGVMYGWRWVLLTVFVAMGSDTGGYFAGRYLGRHKLAPVISPSKTIEGTFGAVAGAVLIAWLCRVAFFSVLGAREAVALGAAISVLAQLGDLGESALKRAFGAKDSGWIIPGHGGILDRLDSLLFPIVFTYYYAALPRT